MNLTKLKLILGSGIVLYCFPMIGYAAVITLDEGPPATSRAAVPANTIPGDVILCQTAVNAAGTDCVNMLDRSAVWR